MFNKKENTGTGLTRGITAAIANDEPKRQCITRQLLVRPIDNILYDIII